MSGAVPTYPRLTGRSHSTGSFWEELFAPAYWVDRHLRPDVWEASR